MHMHSIFTHIHRLYLTVGLLILVSFSAAAQDVDSKIKAVFIYNFTKHINWPSASGTFVIGVLGDLPLASELETMMSKLKGNSNTSFVIKKIASGGNMNSLKDCQILYVSSKENKTLQSIASATNNLPILLVSEGTGMTSKGSVLSFFKDDSNKIKFELNKKELDEHQLKVSNDLLKLAVLVNN